MMYTQSCCYTLLQAFPSECCLTIEMGEKSAYSHTILRQRDHPSTLSLFKVSSFQSILHLQTVDSSLSFLALRCSMWSPFLYCVSPFMWSAILSNNPHTHTHTCIHNLTIWPRLAQTAAKKKHWSTSHIGLLCNALVKQTVVDMTTDIRRYIAL